jgi:hypothetical protein
VLTSALRLFYARLPCPPSPAPARDGRRAPEAGGGPGRGREWGFVLAAAGLAVAGFLAYYLPVYWAPAWFPAVQVSIPATSLAVPLRWGELGWGLAVTAVELLLLTALNIAGVHHVGVATGFVTAATARRARDGLLGLGLERRAVELTRFGLDPFQGLSPSALLFFNTLLRLKGWLGNQAIRYLTRLALGRYAVRSVLDFSGLPLYMALNAFAVRAVLREARVVLAGRRVVARVLAGLPRRALPQVEGRLLYDTLQYVAVSKRDYHRNHYLLARGLLARLGVPREDRHPLPPDYLDQLARAPDRLRALCQAVILLGFVLDGRVSRRERRRLRDLVARGVLREPPEAVARYARTFLGGAGVDGWLAPYLARAAAGEPGVPEPRAEAAPRPAGAPAPTGPPRRP